MPQGTSYSAGNGGGHGRRERRGASAGAHHVAGDCDRLTQPERVRDCAVVGQRVEQGSERHLVLRTRDRVVNPEIHEPGTRGIREAGGFGGDLDAVDAQAGGGALSLDARG